MIAEKYRTVRHFGLAFKMILVKNPTVKGR
jgi:hypothetical protein